MAALFQAQLYKEWTDLWWTVEHVVQCWSLTPTRHDLRVPLSSSREILDQQDGTIEDDGLTGLLRLATSVLKHKPPFKFSREGQEFLRDVHNLLFLLPSLADRAQPKCKSHAARAAAYDLLVETVKGSVENYRLLHNWVMSQHMQGEDAGCFTFKSAVSNFFFYIGPQFKIQSLVGLKGSVTPDI